MSRWWLPSSEYTELCEMMSELGVYVDADKLSMALARDTVAHALYLCGLFGAALPQLRTVLLIYSDHVTWYRF